MLSLIEQNAGNLSNTLDRLLFLFAPMDFESEPCSLSTLVDHAIFNVREHAADKKIKIENNVKTAGRAPRIRADAQKLTIAIAEVLANAIEASTGGSVRVELTSRNRFFILSVSDSGRGISPEDLTNIFEPFFSRSSMKTGLGLAIAKRVIEKHGGRIRIRSQLQSGTIVRISLSQHHEKA